MLKKIDQLNIKMDGYGMVDLKLTSERHLVDNKSNNVRENENQ